MNWPLLIPLWVIVVLFLFHSVLAAKQVFFQIPRTRWVSMCLDIGIVMGYLEMFFSITDPVRVLVCMAIIFMIANLVYIPYVGKTLPTAPGTWKIRMNYLGLIGCIITMFGVWSGYAEVGLWTFAVGFFFVTCWALRRDSPYRSHFFDAHL